MFRFLLLIAMLGIALPSEAQEPPAFTAECTAKESRRLDLYGTIPSWKDDENFLAGWTFVYKGGNHIEIQGKPYPVILVDKIILMVSEPASNDTAGSIWTYAINLDEQSVAAAQVNTSVYGTMKARIVSLGCEFSYQ